ncbi:MAG: 3-hydroxyacyl-CoA dehydrogenase NAD-binding domain-containing protein, partial [Alphaproteobacteria bacterium]
MKQKAHFCSPREPMQAKGYNLPESSKTEIVILGAGFIGLSFAAAFSDAGWQVTLSELDENRRIGAKAKIKVQCEAMELAGLRRNAGGSVRVRNGVGDSLKTTSLVLECGPEILDIKQAIFAALLADSGPQTILATASSAIPMSRILPDESQQARCMVAHPVNPPAILRMIELSPAPATNPDTMDRAAQAFHAAGFTPIVLGHEIEGFILNRLQGAVLREAYRLVDEGVTDVNGIDTVVRLGLGPRWALSGPFETMELNTPGGIRAHAARMGPAYKRMGEARGETVDWSESLVGQVENQRRAVCAEADLPKRAQWRAEAVARLVAVRDK